MKAHQTNAFVVPVADRFACVVNGKKIGLSKDPHHFEYFYKLRHTPKALKDIDIDNFVYVGARGHVEHIHDMHVKVDDVLMKSLKHDARALLKTLTKH